MLGHVFEADHAYAREIGIQVPEGALEDRAAVRAERRAVLEVLGTASDGAPLAGRKWTPRYAARRIAWHALDHAWEMEDRTERDRWSSGRRPAGRVGGGADHAVGLSSPGGPQIAHPGVAVGLRELRAVRSADQRVVDEGRRAPPRRAAGASRICAAVAASRSRPRTTSPTPWRRSSTTTQKPYVQLPVRSRIGRSPVGATSSAQRPDEPVHPRSEPPPSATAATGPSSPRSPAAAGAAGPCHGRPCSSAHAANVDRVQSQP